MEISLLECRSSEWVEWGTLSEMVEGAFAGRAEITFQRLSPEIRDSYDEAMEAL